MRNKKTKEKRIAPMYKRIKSKRVPVCDYHGICINKAFKEVYPVGRSGWNYLCRKHFEQERKRLKDKLPHCSLESRRF